MTISYPFFAINSSQLHKNIYKFICQNGKNMAKNNYLIATLFPYSCHLFSLWQKHQISNLFFSFLYLDTGNYFCQSGRNMANSDHSSNQELDFF